MDMVPFYVPASIPANSVLFIASFAEDDTHGITRCLAGCIITMIEVIQRSSLKLHHSLPAVDVPYDVREPRL